MSIFVSVAAYCDTLLLQTLRDCHRNAQDPKSLVFGVFDQNTVDLRKEIDALPFRKQIRYVRADALDARGPCWARSIVQGLYGGEDHYLQIDAHTIFDTGWDRDLLERLSKLRAYSDKPILSGLPGAFEMIGGKPKKIPYGPNTVWFLGPNKDATLTLETPSYVTGAEHRTGEFIRGHHMAAGFIFTVGSFVEEVPYDPHLYFWGEEQSLSVRAYTRGWDVYHASNLPVYHIYAEKAAPVRESHWNSKVDEKRTDRWWVLRDASHQRLAKLLWGSGLGVYGLGDVRPLTRYREVSGIDYPAMKLEGWGNVKPSLEGYRVPVTLRESVGVGISTGTDQEDIRGLIDVLRSQGASDIRVIGHGPLVVHDGVGRILTGKSTTMGDRQGIILEALLREEHRHIALVHPRHPMPESFLARVRTLGANEYTTQGLHVGMGYDFAKAYREELRRRPNENPFRVLTSVGNTRSFIEK